MRTLQRERITPAAVRHLVLGPWMLAAGLLAALTGAGLAYGIMAYGAIVDGEVYTTHSWLLIAPVWGGLGLLWFLVRRWRTATAAPIGGLAIFAGTFYGDVYGQFPAGLLLLLATAVVFLPEKTKDRSVSVPVEAARTPERQPR